MAWGAKERLPPGRSLGLRRKGRGRTGSGTGHINGGERPAEEVVHDKLGHYATLGVASDADDAAIKSAYRKLALLFHPDRSKHPDAKARFQMIQKSYETLSEPVSRKAYDQIP